MVPNTYKLDRQVCPYFVSWDIQFGLVEKADFFPSLQVFNIIENISCLLVWQFIWVFVRELRDRESEKVSKAVEKGLQVIFPWQSQALHLVCTSEIWGKLKLNHFRLRQVNLYIPWSWLTKLLCGSEVNQVQDLVKLVVNVRLHQEIFSLFP